jgi:hypothetical protein
MSTHILNDMVSNEQHLETVFRLTRISKKEHCILLSNGIIAFGKL